MGCSLPLSAEAKRHGRSDALTDSVMCRIFRYAQQVDTIFHRNQTNHLHNSAATHNDEREARHDHEHRGGQDIATLGLRQQAVDNHIAQR